MLGWGWEKKIPQKIKNRFIVNSFCLAGLDRLVQGKWLAAHMWDRYINKNHPLLDVSLFDAAMLHNSMSANNEIQITYF